MDKESVVHLEQMEGQELAGRFLLRRLVGQGGHGAVFEAEQLSVGRRCAIKVMLPELCENEATVRRFAKEARAISQLVHVNSVILYDFGQSAGSKKLLYLVMEFLDGQDLNQLIEKEGRLSLETTVHIARQVGGSLHEAHMQGLVHRDVKPHNVMLIERHKDPYFVKVIDFGIAKSLENSRMTVQDLTMAGTMIGTPHYMAPEQVLDGEVDGRTDQYALAITIYKMLAGRTPFQGITAIEVASKQLTEQPLPVSVYRKDLQNRGTLDEVLLRALSKHPADRFEDMMAFVDAFAEAVTLIEDQPFFYGESTLVDSPLARASAQESFVAQTGLESVDDDKPGSTLFIAQDFGGAALLSSEEVVAEKAVPEVLVGEVLVGEVAVENVVAEDVVDKSTILETRPTIAEITSPITNRMWLVRGLVAVSCVFALLAGTVLVYLVLNKITAVESHDEMAGDGEFAAALGEVVEVVEVAEEATGGVVGAMRKEKAALQAMNQEKSQAAGKESGLLVRGNAQAQAESWRARKEEQEAAAAARVEARVEARAQVARVQVTLIPWGTLYVNRRAYTDKPRQELRLAPGRYTFILKQSDEEKVRKIVDVEAGSHTMVELVAR